MDSVIFCFNLRMCALTLSYLELAVLLSRLYYSTAAWIGLPCVVLCLYGIHTNERCRILPNLIRSVISTILLVILTIMTFFNMRDAKYTDKTVKIFAFDLFNSVVVFYISVVETSLFIAMGKASPTQSPSVVTDIPEVVEEGHITEDKGVASSNC